MKNISPVITILLLSLLVSCANTNSWKEVQKELFAMDTLIQIKFYVPTNSSIDTAKVLQEIEKCISDIEKKYNVFDTNSFLYYINEKAWEKPIELDEETLKILNTVISFSELTGYAFDPTAIKLYKLWGFHNRNYNVPDKKVLEFVTRYFTGPKKYRIRGGKIELRRKGVEIGLGGCIKGYAIDKVVNILTNYGITNGLIVVGGQVYALGEKPEGEKFRPWKIGVRNPRGEGIVETLSLENKSISTSGDYEKYFFSNGKRYHHIFDTKTGFPAQLDTGLASVSVVHESGFLADILSTALFVMGPEKGLMFAEKYKLPVLFIVVKNQEEYNFIKSSFWKEVM